ncbi:MAG: hypothetical protein WC119_07395 [Synergistaceae bacterium]|nr:hypothetical protein [Candidatus Omnitrophota bacterium]MDD5526963.1 hypothetical protein [Candidatus Omnitrophota bacterium]
MKIVSIPGVLTALSPIHSGSDEGTGNEKTLRTLTYNLPTGPEEVPVISGNAIRGTLRRLIMADLIEQVGFQPTDAKGQVRLYHSLFAGGTLEQVAEKDSGYIDLARKSQIRAVLPPLALLGTAIRNQMLEGKLDVAYAVPRANELAAFLRPDPPITAVLGDLQKQTFNTRRDEMAADAKANGGSSSQMLHTWWYIPPGTVFQHGFTLTNPSVVEAACLGRMIDLWRMRPRLGAKAGTGNAEVRLDYSDVPDPVPYLKFLEDNKANILKMLQTLELG